MAVLVLGVGYIGSQLLHDLLAVGEEVVVVDNFFSTDRQAVEGLASHPHCRLIRGSAGSRLVLDGAFKGRGVTAVYLLAAQSSAHPRAASPRLTETSNLLAPRVVLEAMRRHEVGTVVYGSSLRVYGETSHPDTAEDAPYGVLRDLSHLSKCYVEKLMEMYADLYGLRCLSARLGIVYGPAPVVKMDARFMTAPNKFCLQLARGEPLKLYGNTAGETGFIHAADASAALRAVASNAAFSGYVPVNMATEWTSIRNVAAMAKAAAGKRGLATVIEGEPVAADPSAAIGRRLASCRFVARHTLASGLDEMLARFAATAVTAAQA